MSWKTIRPQINTLIDTIAKVYEMKDTPGLDFNGYPAAHVLPSDNTADYETNKENVRTYAFIVRVFYETKKIGVQTALDRLEDAVDDILDAIDQEDLKGASTRTLGVNLPARYTYLNVYATPGAFFQIPDLELIFAEVTIRVRVSVDVT